MIEQKKNTTACRQSVLRNPDGDLFVSNTVVGFACPKLGWSGY